MAEAPGYVDVELFPEPSERPEKLSADRRRTQRQRDDVARGVHPLMGGALATDPEAKCGNCVHRQVFGHHDRSFPKCDLTSMSHCAASDCRAWWPGCTRHERAAS